MMIIPRIVRYRLWQWKNAVETSVETPAASDWRKDALSWLYVLAALVAVFVPLTVLALLGGAAWRAWYPGDAQDIALVVGALLALPLLWGVIGLHR